VQLIAQNTPQFVNNNRGLCIRKTLLVWREGFPHWKLVPCSSSHPPLNINLGSGRFNEHSPISGSKMEVIFCTSAC
jgi:hypothetical protein